MKKAIPVYIFVFLLAVSFSQVIFYYPNMPETMATHFDSAGNPNGWMSKSSFFLIEILILLISTASFLLMPFLFAKYRVRSGINLPNKDYWLAPSRIDYFYNYFKTSFAWFGVVTLTLLAGTTQLVLEANLTKNPVLNMRPFYILLTGYLGFVIIWTVYFYRKFGRTE